MRHRGVMCCMLSHVVSCGCVSLSVRGCSVQEVMSAARQMMAERKTNKALTRVVFIVAAVYGKRALHHCHSPGRPPTHTRVRLCACAVATIALILAVVVGAVELSKDSKPDASGNLLNTHGAKNVVRTKSKTDVASPFDFASQPLADFEKVGADFDAGRVVLAFMCVCVLV